MKIESLYIERYKLLQNFRISFKKDISILIGINGSGKSSILEAIALIFSNALLNEKTDFKYKIVYDLYFSELHYGSPAETLRDVTVKVTLSNQEQIDNFNFKVSSKNVDLTNALTKGYLFNQVEDIIPKNIVIYYSGISEIMKELCKPHSDKLSYLFREGKQNARSNFFYFEPVYFKIILLTLLSYQYGDIPKFLLDKARIGYLQSVQIILKKPFWAKKQKVDKWWGAEGEVKLFLDYLDSLYPNQEKDGDDIKIGNVVLEAVELQSESLIITIIAQEMLFRIRENYVEERRLFEILNILYHDGFLEDIKFSFYDKDGNSFERLSEGEQQTIIIRGLVELFNNENTLFLFDEPDTYLHPSWQSNFIEDITKTLETNKYDSSAFIITTHSPQLLSNLKSGELHIMSDGKLVKHTNDYYGRDINAILSGYMGADFRPHEFQAIIDEVSELITQKRYDEAKKKLELLNKKDNEYLRLSTKLNFILG